MALTIPRSSTGRTSGRCRRNIRNISADHRPMPFTLRQRRDASSSSIVSSGVERKRSGQDLLAEESRK